MGGKASFRLAMYFSFHGIKGRGGKEALFWLVMYLSFRGSISSGRKSSFRLAMYFSFRGSINIAMYLSFRGNEDSGGKSGHMISEGRWRYMYGFDSISTTTYISREPEESATVAQKMYIFGLIERRVAT